MREVEAADAEEDAVAAVLASAAADPGGAEGRWRRRLARLSVRASALRTAGVSGAAARFRRTEEWRHVSIPSQQQQPSPRSAAACVAMPHSTAGRRRVVYVSLRRLCELQPIAFQLATFFSALETAGKELEDGAPIDGVVLMINAAGMRRVPATFLQHATILLSAHYPGLLANVIVYPITDWREAELRQALPSIDIGQISSWCGSGSLSVPLLCTNSETTLTRELGLCEGGLRWEHLADLQRTRPVPTHTAERQLSPDQSLTATPWHPGGSCPSTVTLEDELADCATLILLTPKERVARLGLRTSVQAAVIRIAGPDADVTVKRVETHRVTIHSDPVELHADGVGPDLLPSISAALREGHGFEPLEPAAAAQPDVLSLVSSDGVVVQLTVSAATAGGQAAGAAQPSPPSHNRARRAAVFRKWLLEFPAAASAYAVLRHMSTEAGCGAGAAGGITRYTLLIMVLHVCRRAAIRESQGRRRRRRGYRRDDAAPPPLLRPEGQEEEEEEAGPTQPLGVTAVFHSFLVYYTSDDFDVATCTVHADHAAPQRRTHPGTGLSVADPLEPATNVAADCVRAPAFFALLNYCRRGLAVGKGKARSSSRRCHTCTQTPLCAIVATEPLWRRRRHLIAAAELRPQQHVPAPDEATAALQGTWEDDRGGVWRVSGCDVHSSTRQYQLVAAPGTAVGASLLGVAVATAAPTEVTWIDGDVWHRREEPPGE